MDFEVPLQWENDTPHFSSVFWDSAPRGEILRAACLSPAADDFVKTQVTLILDFNVPLTPFCSPSQFTKDII